MTDITIPAPSQGSTDTAATQVTSQPAAGQTTEDTTTTKPQAAEPAGTADAASDNPLQDGEQQKSWKDKRAERNRQRWQEYKQAKEVLPQRLAYLEAEVQRLSGRRQQDYSQILDPNEELAERTADKIRASQAEEAAARLQRERARAAAEHESKMFNAWDEARSEARQRIPDFDAVVTDNLPIHARAAPYIVDSENGADIAYYLGKNPQVARQLYQKFETAPAAALIELGRIEARVSAPPPKHTSAAPKPASTISGGVNPVAFDASRASVDDIAQQFRKLGLIR